MNAPSWIFAALIIAFLGLMIYKQTRKGAKSNGIGGSSPKGEELKPDKNQGDQYI